MGLLTSAIVVGATAMGAQAYGARKQRKAAERDMAKNRTMTRNAMQREEIRSDTGADIRLGSEGADSTATDDRKNSNRRRVRTSVPARQGPGQAGTPGNVFGNIIGNNLF